MLDITNYDLYGLQTIHTVYKNILKSDEDELDRISKLEKSDENGFTIKMLSEKIELTKTNIKTVEERIKELAEKEIPFSIENLFRQYGIYKKYLVVRFLAGSNAYQKFGSYVMGIIQYSTDELKEQFERIANNQSGSDGYVKIDDNISKHLSKELKEELKSKGFLASEIYEILSR